MRTRNWIALTAVTMALAAGTTAFAQEAPRGERARAGHGGRLQRWRALRARGAQQARARHELLRSMAFTDAQLRTMLEKSRAAQPIAAEARKELARTLVEAQSAAADGQQPADRQAARQALKAKLKDLRTRTAASLEPLAREVLATLTPEQRAKLEGFAAARGRKLDEARLLRGIGRRLARPMTADLLEARLGTR